MRTIGLKEVAIADLTLPHDFALLLDDPGVATKAESIESLGLIHEPLVLQRDMRVLAGRERIAAHMRLGRTTVMVKLVDCNELEAIEIEFQENIVRRHDPDEQQRLIMERLEEIEKAKEHEVDRTGRPGRPKTPRGMAREKVAAEVGVNPESIRQREYRQRKKAGKVTPKVAKPAPAKDAPKEPPVKTIGLELDAAFNAQVEATQVMLRDAANKLRTASAKLTQLRNAELTFPVGRLDRIRDQLRSVTAAVEGAYPTSLCPYCKGIEGIQQLCGACLGAGFITKDQEQSVPAELWREDLPVVLVQGTMRPLTDYLDDSSSDSSSEEDVWPLG
jgi:ParB-like chromosome segregation protein Spo0J